MLQEMVLLEALLEEMLVSVLFYSGNSEEKAEGDSSTDGNKATWFISLREMRGPCLLCEAF